MAIAHDRDVVPLVAADALVPLVRELIAEVRGLRADLRRRERGQPDDRYARLFPVLGGIVGTERLEELK